MNCMDGKAWACRPGHVTDRGHAGVKNNRQGYRDNGTGLYRVGKKYDFKFPECLKCFYLKHNAGNNAAAGIFNVPGL